MALNPTSIPSTPDTPCIRATYCPACDSITFAYIYGGDYQFKCDHCGSEEAGAFRDTALLALLRTERNKYRRRTERRVSGGRYR